MAETVDGQIRLTPEDAIMPCCGADGNRPGNVKVMGWALIPERIDCNCGASWYIVAGNDFDGCDPDHTFIERRSDSEVAADAPYEAEVERRRAVGG